ncbi:TIR domain-containing protein [Frankia sp. Ag45/Mut15]|uniref:TIR domain-containing protein n=1 Tax=Frankia umida TaxID=573489 RepID=A0ABT0K4L1_9ACTN|nr:toll/interleukin-1 receptor domain-containing protein [Frankia umida]MCK9878731.1 TIR domain-containing protein [Frankia umida]
MFFGSRPWPVVALPPNIRNPFASERQFDVAEWVAWTLEQERYRVLIQAWDSVPGTDWPRMVRDGVSRGRRLLAVVTPAYLESAGASAEWLAVWAADMDGADRRLIPLLIEDCAPTALSLLGTRTWIDLRRYRAEQGATHAGPALLAGLKEAEAGRAKPTQPVPLPARVRRTRMPPTPDSTAPASASTPTPTPTPTPTRARTATVWHMPPRLPHFVGRSDLLDDMARRLAASGRAAVCGVRGLGGVGKTVLAVEYAYQHAAEFDAVWWIPAEDPDLIPGYVSALGVALGLPDGAAWPSVAGALRQQQRRWLLVLDNVEDAETVGALVGFGLARRDGRDGADLSVHRLISAAVQSGVSATDRTATAVTLIRLLRSTLPGDTKNPRSWPRWRSLLPHVRAVLNLADPETGENQVAQATFWLNDRTGSYLAQHGQLAPAISYLGRGQALSASILGPDHTITRTITNNLAAAKAGHDRRG